MDKVFKFSVTVTFLGVEVTAPTRDEARRIINEGWSIFDTIDHAMGGTSANQIEDE